MIKDIRSGMIKFDVREDVPTDEIVIREIWEENVYEVHSPMFYDEELGSKTTIDIGANIGSFAIFAAAHGATVYAIEPEPHNLAALKKNIRLNKMQDKITVIDKGVSDFVGTAVISNEGGGSTILDDVDGATISITTLDNIFDENNIEHVSVLKIDVEGSEVEIITGASYETLNKCDYITIEFDVRTGKYLGDMVKKLSESHHVRTMGSWERGGMIFARRY